MQTKEWFNIKSILYRFRSPDCNGIPRPLRGYSGKQEIAPNNLKEIYANKWY
jgi:hypothetical protein